MNNIALTLFMTIISATCFCQNKVDTIYYNVDWEKSDKSNATYFRLLTKKNSNFYICKDYWLTGETQMEGGLSKLEPEVREGKFVWYNKNGTKSSEMYYKDDKIMGTIKIFNIDNRKVVEFVASIDSLDNAVEIKEMYPKFVSYIENNLKYPAIARENGIQGSVLIQFFVDSKSEIFGIKVLRSIHDSLDQVAVKLLSGFKWPKTIYKNKATTMRYTLPIKFTLTD